MNKVIIMSRREAEAVDFCGCPIVSITDPRLGPATLSNAGNICRVQFNDYVRVENLPRSEIKKIFNFLESHSNADVLFVHCEAGVSRSAGVALFCAEQYGSIVDMRHKSPNLALVEILRHIKFEKAYLYEEEEST